MKYFNIIEEIMRIILESIVWGFCCILFAAAVLFAATVAEGQLVEEMPGVLYVDRTNTTPTNVTYTKNGQIVSEVFHAPEVVAVHNPVSFLTFSTNNPEREIDAIPTYGLARWHWWLTGFVLLPMAQKQYGECVAQIKVYQELVGHTPAIDAPNSVLHGIIVSVRDYQVPFDALQNHQTKTLPPTIEDAKAHFAAALVSYNINVYHIGLCKQTLNWYRSLVQ